MYSALIQCPRCRAELASLEHQYGQRLAQARITSPDASSVGTARPLSLKEIQRRIPPDTTLVVYTNITGKMTAFVVKRESFDTFDLPGVDEEQFETTLAEFHDFGDDSAVPHSSRALYDYLIRPFRGRLNSSRLIIVPAGLLHYVPFAALYDGNGFLGDTFALSYMPTPSALTSSTRVDHVYETTALTLANSSAPGFSYIPYAAEAAKAIGSLFNTTALIDSEATRPALLKKVAGSRYVLLAAHSTLDKETALFTRLYLAPSDGDQGYLELHEIQDLQLACELVVLSGCDTTLGDVTRGNEVSGLSRAFLTAGVRAVIASQWEVPDQSTGDVVTALFKHLHDGMTASRALQEAQREVRAKYPAPYYWAGFLVLGEDAPAD